MKIFSVGGPSNDTKAPSEAAILDCTVEDGNEWFPADVRYWFRQYHLYKYEVVIWRRRRHHVVLLQDSYQKGTALEHAILPVATIVRSLMFASLDKFKNIYFFEVSGSNLGHQAWLVDLEQECDNNGKFKRYFRQVRRKASEYLFCHLIDESTSPFVVNGDFVGVSASDLI